MSELLKITGIGKYLGIKLRSNKLTKKQKTIVNELECSVKIILDKYK